MESSSSECGNLHIKPTRSDRRVAPAPRSCDEIIDIRPGRTIRVRHLNSKSRDEKFAKEMDVYLQARQNGLVGGVFMPHRTSVMQNTVKAPDDASKSVVSLNYRKEKSVENSSLDDGDKENDKLQDESQKSRDNRSSKSRKSAKSVKHDEADKIDLDKSLNALVSEENESKGWVSKALSRNTELLSPSRVSVAHSEGVQSASGIHVSVPRPSSETDPMNSILESGERVENLNLNGRVSPIAESLKSSRSPRKTKGHRPISAKNIQGAKSLASSEIDDIADLSDFESAVSHKESSFKDVTIFFIHGVGGSADIWNAQIDLFASLGLEVIAPDLMGHGFSRCSDNARDYHFNEILADMEALFDKYCKKQNIIVAHSYG